MEEQLVGTAITTIPQIIGSVQSWMQFLVFIILLVCAMVFLWVKEGSATQKRTAARDAEIKQLNSDLSEVKRTAEGIGRSLDEHYKEHNKWEDRIDNKFETMDGRLKIIEDNLIRRDEFLKVFDLIHVIDKRVAVISVRNEYEDKAAAAAARIGL